MDHQPNYCQQQAEQQPMNVPSPTPPSTIYSNPVSVIGPQYCLPLPVDLAIFRKFMTLTDGSFTVTDINRNVMFKVKEKHFSLRDKRKLLDPAGNPVITITEKVLSAHEKHYVFRGDSTNSKDLLFTVKQLKSTLNVYLASNPRKDVCDFMVKGSWTERACTIVAGETNTVVAQMQMRETVGSGLLNKDRFTVTVHPNIDYAFIVALIVILDNINGDSDSE